MIRTRTRRASFVRSDASTPQILRYVLGLTSAAIVLSASAVWMLGSAVEVFL
jgi:hypothetical protein